jgi:hypothetical protein
MQALDLYVKVLAGSIRNASFAKRTPASFFLLGRLDL